MVKDIVIKAEAWAAFEKVLADNANRGGDKMVREVRAHIELFGWQDWWPIGDRAIARHSIFAVYRSWSSFRFAETRHRQLLEAEMPYWVFHHGNSLDPRPSHVAWDGIALPPEHPFWALHFPPCGWGCSCYVSGARSEAGIRRLRGDPDKKLPDGWDVPQPETGRPLGVDWQYEGQRWPTLLQIVEAVVGGKHP